MLALTTSEREKLLKIPLFKDLASGDVDQLLAAARVVKVDRDGYYFYQGDPATSLFILKSGRLKLSQVNAEGQQILMRILGPWSLFAAVTLVTDSTYPVSAQAAEPCQALVWTQNEILELMSANPRLAMNAMTLLTGYVKDFQDRFRELATERVERRLAHAVLRLSATPDSAGQPVIAVTRQDLAEMTATTLFTVSRILSQWEENGLVVSGREKVTLRDVPGLRRIAEPEA